MARPRPAAMLRVLKSINNSTIVTRPHLSATSSTPSGNTRSVPAKPPSNSASRPAAFTRCPPLTTPRASASHSGSGRPALPVAIMPLLGHSPSWTCSRNAWTVRRRVLTASRLLRRSACTPSNSTAPRSAAGRSKTGSPMPSTPKNPGRRPPLATRPNRRTLATRRFAAPVVSSLPDRLPHAQSAQ